jgi:glutamate-1-semialdehyde aminotransferase
MSKNNNIKQLEKFIKSSKKLIPGGGTMLFSKIPENFLNKGWPSYYKRTKGIYLWDLFNTKFLDFYFGVGQSTLGYNRKEIDDAVIEVCRNGNMSSLSCPEELFLAEKMNEINPWADMSRFARSGGEANAIAIRIARAFTKKDGIAICGYHGWHDWYLSANIRSSNKLNTLLMPGLPVDGVPMSLKKTTHIFKYNNIESFYRILKRNHDIGVVKMEVRRTEEPKNNFLQEIREICNKKKLVLIFDECTTGFRETYGGLYKLYNVKPDIVVYGKALGNGYAITSVVGKGSVMRSAKNTFISSTFWTERIGYVAALETLKVMKKLKSWNIITENGKKIKKLWSLLAKKNNLNVNITGLDALPLLAFPGKNNLKYKTLITQEMLKNKIIASNVVYASILHKGSLLETYKKSLEKIFIKIAKSENNSKKIDEYLDDKVCRSGFGRLN